MSINMLRRKPAAKKLGICTSQSYIHEKEGLIPEFVSIGARAMAVSEKEIDVVNAARMAGKSNDEIKVIVRQLMDDRKVFSMEANDHD